MIKHFSTLLVILLFNFSHGQKSGSIDTLHIEDARAFNTKKHKSKIIVNTLVLEDGTILKKGSSLIIGNPSNSDFKEVENTADEFTMIFGDRYSAIGATSCQNEGVGLESSWINTEIHINEIRFHRRLKTIIVNFTLRNGGTVCSGKFGHIVHLKKALLRREIVHLNSPMSKEEAMEKLLEAKNLYELEVMTKEEYDAIKLKLTPILKGGN
jgi:hypothetical protein